MIHINLGRMNTLKVEKEVDFGYYLDGGPTYGRILLPHGEVRHEGKLRRGEEVECFIYLDQEERLVATMQRPFAQVGQFAYLEVAWVNQYGAFLKWGLMKDLFVPFREQKMRMEVGQRYIVYVMLDEESYRIMATAKVERYLFNTASALREDRRRMPRYKVGDEVSCLVQQKTDLGFKVIVDQQYGGVIYDTQVFRELHTGDALQAYIQQVRPDGKLDLMLQRPGQDAVKDFSDILLDYLLTNNGHTVLCDKSPAEDIYATFGVSKKVFKKAVGDLYKRRLIEISEEGLTLL